MHFNKLEEPDVVALARAAGLDATADRVASLVATLRIVNPMRETLWARPAGTSSEPCHIFAPAKDEGEA